MLGQYGLSNNFIYLFIYFAFSFLFNLILSYYFFSKQQDLLLHVIRFETFEFHLV
jgi:hypothetical protein